MKKLLILPFILLSLTACNRQNNIHLLCTTDIAEHPSTDPNVKKFYDVTVKFLDDGAILTVDGNEYTLRQQYDARIIYYSDNPWYVLQIGNRDYATKYTLGIPTNEGFARYTLCKEIK